MKIAVIGSGAIGCLVAGYLKLKDEDVSLVGRAQTVKEIKSKKLEISGVRGKFKIDIEISDGLNYIPDLVILAVKTQDIEAALKDNISLIRGAVILNAQNGAQADNIVAKYLPKENIVSSIIMFGATNLEPGKVVHNFEGSWIVGRMGKRQSVKASKYQDEKINETADVLNTVFPVVLSEDILGMKFLKIFANANNCIPAILGKSMQEVFSDLEISRISIAIWKEAFEVCSRAKINLVSLPGFPVENVTKLTSMPSVQAAGIFSGIMNKLSKEPLYGSILQSIMRGKLSEIDYINGEFVRVAEANKTYAPLNSILVDMVHRVEKNNRFFSKEELINATKDLLN